MMILGGLFAWAVSLFVVFLVTRAAVQGGVMELLNEARRSNELLARLVKADAPEPTPLRAPVAAVGVAPAMSAADEEQAKSLMDEAQNHHFSKRFAEARTTYAAIVERFPSSKQATAAKHQLDNLRNA